MIDNALSREQLMAIPITIPRLGWNMEEGVFGGWLKKNGEPVRAGEAVFTLETDKATENVESLDTGILNIAANSPNPGETVAVGVVIAYLLKAGETAPLTNESSQPAAPVVPERKAPTLTRSGTQSGPAISPRARRYALKLGIDWMNLTGSGRTGRIRERDVWAAALEESLPGPLPDAGMVE
jgi:pyruvate dehydrogenase E2 component (dihydrolipoamide acetyltransferase)